MTLHNLRPAQLCLRNKGIGPVGHKNYKYRNYKFIVLQTQFSWNKYLVIKKIQLLRLFVLILYKQLSSWKGKKIVMSVYLCCPWVYQPALFNIYIQFSVWSVGQFLCYSMTNRHHLILIKVEIEFVTNLILQYMKL